ncbi:MAG: ABC transporter substrate-binding protein, partial [Chloroflexi bacterium]|nr:ABC transporter substrate-binding protein [Chloroflexota bacterium]
MRDTRFSSRVTRSLVLVVALAVAACGGTAPTTAPAPASKAPEAAKPAAPEAAKPAAPASAPTQSSAAPAKPAAGNPAVKEFVVGAVYPLTGNFSTLGQTLYLWTSQTVEDIVNNDYPDLKVPGGPGKGLNGLGGAPIRFVVRDDQSKGDVARTLVEQLITVDKVHWFDGEGTSGITAQIQPVAEQAGIPMSCSPCSSPSLTEKGLKWFWRTGPHDGLMVGNLFQFLKEWPENGGPKDLKTIAMFSCDNVFCQDGRKIALEQAPKIGLQVALDLTTKTGSQTFSSEVQRLQSANADILFFTQYPPETVVFQADAKRLNYNPKVIVTNNGQYSDQLWLDAQKKTNGGVGWMGRDPTALDLASKNPRYRAINEIYKKYSNGTSMGEGAMRQVTGLLWMVDAINR